MKTYDIEELTNILMDGEKISENGAKHGEIIRIDFEAYYDVIIYEDGYEEWIPIGD